MIKGTYFTEIAHAGLGYGALAVNASQEIAPYELACCLITCKEPLSAVPEPTLLLTVSRQPTLLGWC